MPDTLESLAADLSRMAISVGPAIRPIVRRNAAKVKKDWQSTPPWNSTKTLKHLASSITYETHSSAAHAEALIGPEKGGQGSLGHIIEFGSTRTPPRPGGGPAAAKVAPVFEAELAAVVVALLGVGASTLRTARDPSRFNPQRSGAAWPGFD